MPRTKREYLCNAWRYEKFQLFQKNKIPIIEDACESLGAKPNEVLRRKLM